MNTPSKVIKEPRPQREVPSSSMLSSELSALGFLVADAKLTFLSANEEAIAILTYGEKEGRPQSLATAFDGKIRRHLIHNGLSKGAPLAMISSGRRRYFCRMFRLDGNRHAPNAAAIVMVFERGISGTLALSHITQQFRLTRREREAVALLLQGLSNKEIADRMAISANTVKALLHLVMAKMAVSSRSAIVARILGLMLSSTPN